MNGKLIVYQGETRIKTPTAYLSRSTFQNCANGVETTLSPDASLWNNNDFWSLTANPSRMTFKSAGLYLLGGLIMYNGPGGTTAQRLRLRLNGTTAILDYRTNEWNDDPHASPFSTLYYFHANDYLEVLETIFANGMSCRLVNWWSLAITPEGLIP